MNLKINKYIPLGILLIILGGSLYFLSGVDQFIRPFTQPILMGSSKGKDILFFVLFGITLILSCIGDNSLLYKYAKGMNIPEKLKDKDFYLELSFVLLAFTLIAGIISEFILRNNLGIGWNTILVAMNPTYTSTSILHSHLYKSIFGVILGIFLSHIPAGIHTGSSLSPYTPSIINLLFILIPITYIVMILSLQRRKVLSRIILSFTITLAMIGIIDGGMFGTPAIGGLYGILILMFNGTIIDEISDFLTKKEEGKKDIKSILKEEWKVIKSVFLLRIKNNQKAIKKYFKIALPHIALILIIILRFSISFYGAAPDCYELTVYNGHDIDLENN